MFILSISGLFRTILIIIGVIVLLRFIGQFMIARRNMAEQQAMKQRESATRNMKRAVEKNLGKTQVVSGKNQSHAEDVDYEEL